MTRGCCVCIACLTVCVCVCVKVNEEHCFISIPTQHATRIYNSGAGGPHSLVLRLEKLIYAAEDGQMQRYASCVYIYIYMYVCMCVCVFASVKIESISIEQHVTTRHED